MMVQWRRRPSVPQLFAVPDRTRPTSCCYDDDIRILLLRCGVGDLVALGRLYDATAVWVYPLICQATSSHAAATALTIGVYQRIWTRSPGFDCTTDCAVSWVLRQVHDQLTATVPVFR